MTNNNNVRDAAFRMMVRKNLFSFWQFCWKAVLFAQFFPPSPYDISPSFAFFKLKLVRWGIGLLVRSVFIRFLLILFVVFLRDRFLGNYTIFVLYLLPMSAILKYHKIGYHVLC